MLNENYPSQIGLRRMGAVSMFLMAIQEVLEY